MMASSVKNGIDRLQNMALIAGMAPSTCNFFSKSEKGNY